LHYYKALQIACKKGDECGRWCKAARDLPATIDGDCNQMAYKQRHTNSEGSQNLQKHQHKHQSTIQDTAKHTIWSKTGASYPTAYQAVTGA